MPQTLGDSITGLGASRLVFLGLTLFVFVVIGALLEGLPALLIFGPILFPIGRALGVDPVHYGIVIVAAMGIAFFLPPVGVGLAIASGIARVDVDEVSRAYWPYLVVRLAGLALIGAWRGLTLVLPRGDPRLPGIADKRGSRRAVVYDLPNVADKWAGGPWPGGSSAGEGLGLGGEARAP